MPGTVAHYLLSADPDERPDYEKENQLTIVSARIKLGPVVAIPDRGQFQWYCLEWTRLNGQTAEMWILLDRWPEADKGPEVARYLWYESEWPDAVSYTHEVTGEPLLPRICLWSYGWPQDAVSGGGENRAPVAGTPERILLHGWIFQRKSVEQQKVSVPSTWTTLRLNPDLLIGWTFHETDIDGRPHYRLTDKYRFRKKSEQELLAHIQAGSNFVSGRPESETFTENLIRSGIYYGSLFYRFTDWPAPLYRSNYWGQMNHHDEPSLTNLGRKGPASNVAEELQKIVQSGTRPVGINDRIDSRFGRGDMFIRENENPTWEVLWETSWYQLALPEVGGIVDQDTKMEGAGVLVHQYNMSYGTQIPPTIENSCAIRTAVMRGAARNFNKKWGIGLYEPDNVRTRSAEIPCFYNKGATYFWAWTGWDGLEDDSGLPYPYQRYYFSLLRSIFERNPNRDMDALLHEARVAVVIPYGYTFSPYHMHRTVWLALENRNESGITYRQVLTNAALEVERLLRLGIEFDIAVDDPLFNPKGYEELVYIQEDGKVRIEYPDGRRRLLQSARDFNRPDLGPMPVLSIEADGVNPYAPGRITFKAHPRIGTGDWAQETSWPEVFWEIYDGEKILELTYSALWATKGQELIYKFEKEGTYIVRASLTDVFGRPAIAYKTIEVAPE